MLALIWFAFRRLVSKTGFLLLMVTSSSLAVALAIGVPEFSNAASKRIMQEELGKRVPSSQGHRFAVRLSMPVHANTQMSLDAATYARDWMADLLSRELRLRVSSAYMQSTSPSLYLRTRPGDEFYDPNLVQAVKLSYVPDLADHIEVIEGDPFGSPAPAGLLQVWIERNLAETSGYTVGDVFHLSDPTSPKKEPVDTRIAGIWTYLGGGGEWYGRHSVSLPHSLITTKDQYESYVAPLCAGFTERNIWHIILDDSTLQLGRADFYLDALTEVEKQVRQRFPAAAMELSPRQELEQAHQRMLGLSALLFGLSLPFWASILVFILSLSSVSGRAQESEIATLVSRGSSRWQVFGLLLIENGLVLVLALPLGVAGGLALAHLMGNAQGFLTFTSREPLQVGLETVNWGLALLAGVITLAARLIAMASASRLSIVTYERSASRRSLGAMALLGVGMITLVAATVYTYWRLRETNAGQLLAWRPEGAGINDPLLVLAPALFLLTNALLIAQLFALPINPLGLIAKRLGSSAYLGLLNLSREGNLYRLPIFLLVLCLGFGAFYVSLAKSANIWLVDRLRYQVGADLTFQQGDERDPLSQGTGETGRESAAWALPISDYEQMEGVARATAVGDYSARILVSSQTSEVRLLAIDRLSFPQVVYYRRDLSPNPLGELMNRLGMHPDGILLPADLMAQLQLSPGDNISLRVWLGKYDQVFQFTIVDSFDYFPTMYPNDAFALVANLDYMQTVTSGSFSHGIWMRLEPEASAEAVLTAVRRLGVNAVQPRDLREITTDDLQQLERVGVFGMLTICFVGVAFLACLGFTIVGFYTVTSRIVRFGVLQALGMKRHEITASVALELGVTLAFGIVVGSLFGMSAAHIYVPHLALLNDTAAAIPPFIPIFDWERALLLGSVMFALLLTIEALLIVRVLRTKPFALLRMGLRP